MEGETRANLNYLEQLYKFHRQAGHPVHKIPQLDKRPIDLFRLKKEVAQRGGYQMVCTSPVWELSYNSYHGSLTHLLLMIIGHRSKKMGRNRPSFGLH
jgi:hypothetical protein